MITNKLIVFEGLDGSGKTTLANHMAKEIGGTYLYSLSKTFLPLKDGVNDRMNPLVRYMYYLTSLVDLQKDLLPLLQVGSVVVDRYLDSTIAYHLALGVDVSVVDYAKLPIMRPDNVFIVSTSEEVRLRRIRNRDGETKSSWDVPGNDEVASQIRDHFNNSERLAFPNVSHNIDNTNLENAIELVSTIISREK